MSRPAWAGRLIGLLLIVGLLVSLRNVGLFDPARLTRGARNIGIFVGGLFPPDGGVLPTVAAAMLETLQIAFLGTAIGFLLALPLALAANRALFGGPIAGAVLLVLALVRTVPSLLWGIVFVVAVGLGPAAGTLGIAAYSLGYLGKLLAETFDGVDPEVLEAVRGVGCGRLQLARYALLPEAANGVLAQLLFMFEYNVRASSIMGFVGAGGIGFYLLGYIQMLRYDSLLTALLVTLAVVVLIDRLSARLRAMVLAPVGPGAAGGR
jgi:phosphonate transport system permease protein